LRSSSAVSPIAKPIASIPPVDVLAMRLRHEGAATSVMVGQIAEQPAAEWAHQKPGRRTEARH